MHSTGQLENGVWKFENGDCKALIERVRVDGRAMYDITLKYPLDGPSWGARTLTKLTLIDAFTVAKRHCGIWS